MYDRLNLDSLIYYSECFSYATVGAILGLTIDILSAKLQLKYDIRPGLMWLIQMFVLITVLYIVETFISRQFAQDWQSTTKGLFFVFLYFGLQNNLYQNSNLFIRSNHKNNILL